MKRMVVVAVQYQIKKLGNSPEKISTLKAEE